MNIKNKIQDTRYKIQARKGFTLVELLVVIGIIAILFAVVLVAINPAKRFAESSNARRLADVNSILGAITTSTVDLKGTLPSGLTMGSGTALTPNAIKPRFIGTGTTNISTASATTFTANVCYGVSTCALTGFACASNNDCPSVAETSTTNVCNTTASRCILSGRYCAANADCLSSTSSATNDCVTGATRVLTTSGQTGTCLNSLNPCTGTGASGASADCTVMSASNNTCTTTTNTIGYIRPYDLSTSGEGLVPAYIGAMPKDPSGSGFMGTSPTLSDSQTGYVVSNVPTTTASFALVNGATAITGTAAAAQATIITSEPTLLTEPQVGSKVQVGTDAQIKTVVSKALNGTPRMVLTMDSNFATAISTAAAITVFPNVSVATATNRIKVVSCNPNDSDSDGSYTNNKIEVLR